MFLRKTALRTTDTFSHSRHPKAGGVKGEAGDEPLSQWDLGIFLKTQRFPLTHKGVAVFFKCPKRFFKKTTGVREENPQNRSALDLLPIHPEF